MSEESCPERRALAHAVVAAITETFRTQAAYDMAKRKGNRDLDTPARVLVESDTTGDIAFHCKRDIILYGLSDQQANFTLRGNRVPS